MIETITSAEPVISVTVGDRATEDIIDSLAIEMRRCLEATGQIPNLVIARESASDDGKLHAIEERLASILDHRMHPRKIAFVDGTPARLAVSDLRRQLKATLIRHFDAQHLDYAMKWAGTPNDKPGRLIPLGDVAPHVAGFKSEGQITEHEYINIFEKTVNDKLATYSKINLLIIFGSEFDSFSESAIWKDFDFGIAHQTAFEKIAVVTVSGAFAHGEKIFAPLSWAELRSFSLANVEQAYAWVCSNIGEGAARSDEPD